MKCLDMYGHNLEDVTAAEEHYPLDQWLEDLMALGHPFFQFGHYQLAFGRRLGLMGPTREEWYNGIPEYSSITGKLWNGGTKAGLLQELELPPDTTWDEYIEMHNKFSVVRLMNVLLAQEIDPDVEGGLTDLDGSFLPFSPNLVNVHIDPETGRTKFVGARLTSAEEEALVNFGVAPEGMSVVYIDADNKPLPLGEVPPRFYERNMEELEKAQVSLQQQIEDHEFLLEMDTFLNSPEETQPSGTVPPEQARGDDPGHTAEPPTSQKPGSPEQRPPPAVKQLLMSSFYSKLVRLKASAPRCQATPPRATYPGDDLSMVYAARSPAWGRTAKRFAGSPGGYHGIGEDPAGR